MSTVEGLLAGGLVAGLLLLGGSPLLMRGLKHRARYLRFSETPVVPPATATPGETALLVGTVHAGDESVTAPLSNQRAVLATWEIASLRRYGILASKSVWRTEALGIDSSEFELHSDGERVAVEDWSHSDRIEGTEALSLTGTGELPVVGLDVGGLWVEIEAFDIDTRIRPGETVPQPYQGLAERVGFTPDFEAFAADPSLHSRILANLRTPKRTLRYREASICEGQQITVLGTVRSSVTPGGPLRVVEPSDRPGLISPHDPERLLVRYRRSYWLWTYGLVAVALVTASLAGLAVAM